MAATQLTYERAGVRHLKGDPQWRRFLAPLGRRTSVPGVLGSIGSFGGLFAMSAVGMKDPILVGAADGVGTKLLLAETDAQRHAIGVDLVAMNVNDVICLGARPLFFLDYIAIGKLDMRLMRPLMQGIVAGCRQAGCALLGGETAQMPGLYREGHYDMAGFCVGAVERRRILDGRSVRAGDCLVGLASSGPHANGFSLLRKLYSPAEIQSRQKQFLKPTRIYESWVRPALEVNQIHALAHITGGGMAGNLPRVLPAKVSARIRLKSWPVPKVFREIQSRMWVSDPEMRRTFNLGLGMIAVVPELYAHRWVRRLRATRKSAWVIGEVIAKPGRHVEFVGA